MANKIKGLTIEIGGETTALNKALAGVNKQSRDLQSELRQVDRLLKLDPGNTDLLNQKQKILAESVGTTKDKLDKLKTAAQQAYEQLEKGEISEEQFRALQREVVKTEENLKKLEKQSKDFGSTFAQQMKTAGKNVKDFGDKTGEIGKKLLPVTGIIAGVGAASFKMAADMEDALGATDQIFGGASDGMKEWAKDLESYYGIASSEALEYSNMMGTMLKNIGGLTEEEAAKQSQTLIKLAGDLTAMYGGTTADAVRALTGALKGNNTMLDNYGMAANDALVKAKAFEMGIYDGTGQMELATKQAATLALIMEQSGEAQGQAAREAEGASGAMRAFATEVKNLSASIGEILLPIITPLIQKISEFVKWLGSLDEGTKKTIITIAGIVAAIGPLLIIIGQVATGIGAIMKILPLLMGPVGIIIGLVAALTAGLVAYSAATNDSESASSKFGEEVKALGKELDTLKGKTEDLTTSFDTQTDEAKSLTDELYNLEQQLQSGTLTEEEAEAVKNKMHDIMRQLKNIIPDLVIALDDETSTLSKQRGEVESLIDSYIRLAKAKAAQTLLAEAEEKALRAKTQLKTAETSRAGAQWNIDYLSGRTTPTGDVTPEEANRNRQLLQTETKALKEWSEALYESGDNVYRLEKESEALKKVIEETGITSKELNETTSNLEGAGKAAGKAVSGGAKKASKATKDASKEIQDEFNKRQRNLKFNLDMGYITEAKYYEGLEVLRDGYFDEGTDEWQRYTLEIANFQKKTFESVKKDVEDTFKSITDNMKVELDEVERLKSSFESKLKGYTPLFSSQTVRIKNWNGGDTLEFEKNTLSNFKETLGRFTRFSTLLNQVKDRGISRAMFNEIMNLSIDDGIKFMELLLGADDNDYDSYMASHNAVQAVSKSLSDYTYKDETQEIADRYYNSLAEALGSLTSEYTDIGSQYAQAMGEGFTGQLKQVFAIMSEDIRVRINSLGSLYSTSIQKYKDGGIQGKGGTNVSITQQFYTPTATPSQTSQATKKGIKSLELAGVL